MDYSINVNICWSFSGNKAFYQNKASAYTQTPSLLLSVTNHQKPVSTCSRDNNAGVTCPQQAKDMFNNMLLPTAPPHLLKRHPCSNHAKSKLIFSAFHRKGGRVTEPETCWIYGVDQSAPNLMTWLPTRRPPAPCPLTESQLHRSSFKHAAAPRKFLFFHH